MKSDCQLRAPVGKLLPLNEGKESRERVNVRVHATTSAILCFAEQSNHFANLFTCNAVRTNTIEGHQVGGRTEHPRVGGSIPSLAIAVTGGQNSAKFARILEIVGRPPGDAAVARG